MIFFLISLYLNLLSFFIRSYRTTYVKIFYKTLHHILNFMIVKIIQNSVLLSFMSFVDGNSGFIHFLFSVFSSLEESRYNHSIFNKKSDYIFQHFAKIGEHFLQYFTKIGEHFPQYFAKTGERFSQYFTKIEEHFSKYFA